MSCASINIHTLDANSLTSLLLDFPFSSKESVSRQTYLKIGFNIFFFIKIQSNLKKKSRRRTLCVMLLKWRALLEPCPISVLVTLIMESKAVGDPGI